MGSWGALPGKKEDGMANSIKIKVNGLTHGVTASLDTPLLYVLHNELDFRDYVVNYTNAAAIVGDDFRDTDDLDGLFSGWDPEKKQYDTASWQYETEEGREPSTEAHRELVEEAGDELTSLVGVRHHGGGRPATRGGDELAAIAGIAARVAEIPILRGAVEADAEAPAGHLRGYHLDCQPLRDD